MSCVVVIGVGEGEGTFSGSAEGWYTVGEIEGVHAGGSEDVLLHVGGEGLFASLLDECAQQDVCGVHVLVAGAGREMQFIDLGQIG